MRTAHCNDPAQKIAVPMQYTEHQGEFGCGGDDMKTHRLLAIVSVLAGVSGALGADWFIGFDDPNEVVTVEVDETVTGNVFIQDHR